MATVSTQEDIKPHSQIYPFLPLDHSRHEIRLITVLPSDNIKAPVSCKLEVAELTEDLQYAALSYVWGNPEVTEDIMVNGFTLPVTTNLESALRNFRQYGFPKEASKLQYLWVDAICINQDKEDMDAVTEKNEQVAFMGDIYKGASAVLSWLGNPGPDQIDEALQILKKYASKVEEFKVGQNADWALESLSWFESTLGPVLDPSGKLSAKWAPLKALADNDYWHRVWTLQETVLCKSPAYHWVICGNASVTASELKAEGMLMIEFKRTHIIQSETNSLGYDLKSTLAFEDCLRLTIDTYFFEYLPGQYPQMRQGIFSTALVLNLGRRATDPRDYIYSLLGIYRNTGIIPDYSKEKTVKDVFADAVARGSHNQLDTCLRFCGGCGHNINNEHELPSWMPDMTLTEYPDVFFDKRKAPMPLLGSTAETRYIAPDSLHVRGVEFAQVELIKRLDIDETSRTNGKIWTQFCIDFLVEFLGPSRATKTWTSLDSERIPGRTRQLPLEALINILTWQTIILHNRESRYKVGPSGDGSIPLNFMYLICLEGLGKLSEEERDEVSKKLDLPPSTSLDAFMESCFYDTEDESLYFNSEFVSEERNEVAASSFADLLREYTMFKTKEGYIGKGPPGLQPGDLLCGLNTLTLPMILRRVTPLDGSSSEEVFNVVGRCYVPGLSDGEPAGMVERGELQIRDFLLR